MSKASNSSDERQLAAAEDLLLNALTAVDEDDWPTFQDKRGSTQRATEQQVKLLMLHEHGVQTELAAALVGYHVGYARTVLTREWAKEWLKARIASRVVSAGGLAISTLQSLLVYGKSEKVKADVAMWLLEHTGALEATQPGGAGGGGGVSLSVTLAPGDGAGTTVVVDGTRVEPSAVLATGGPEPERG